MTTDTPSRPREASVLRGVYYMQEVANLVNATDSRIRGRAFCVQAATVRGWGRRGFFGVAQDEFARNRSFIRFGGLITSRMVALLRSYGVALERIQQAHTYLKCETGLTSPFTSRRFWIETQDSPGHLYAELDKLVVTASKHGHLTFTQLLFGEIEYPNDMEFEDTEHELVKTWNPVPGIVINPLKQSGAPCLAETRTPTYTLHGCHVAGDSVEDIAFWYDLSEDQVQTAIQWEERMAMAQ